MTPRAVRRHRFVQVGLVLACLGAGACRRSSPSMLHPAGSEARRVAGLWWLMFGLAAGVYAIVGGFIVFAVVRGRRTEGGKPSRISDSAFVWWGGIIVPVIILMVLAVETVSATAALRKPDSRALKVEVVGKRWWWQVTYPGQGITTANEIHIPAGQPVEIGLDSDNVIHSFWVPQLAGKVDMIPGQHNVLRFTAGTPGTYKGACAEFCGLEHGLMRFVVIVDPPDGFGRWVARNQLTPAVDTEQASEGQIVFNRETCAGCHTIKGTQAQGKVGPDLTDFGSRTMIGAATVPNDPQHLQQWITDAQSIKRGVLMPPVPLSSRDAQAVVAYLESLR